MHLATVLLVVLFAFTFFNVECSGILNKVKSTVKKVASKLPKKGQSEDSPSKKDDEGSSSSTKETTSRDDNRNNRDEPDRYDRRRRKSSWRREYRDDDDLDASFDDDDEDDDYRDDCTDCHGRKVKKHCKKLAKAYCEGINGVFASPMYPPSLYAQGGLLQPRNPFLPPPPNPLGYGQSVYPPFSPPPLYGQPLVQQPPPPLPLRPVQQPAQQPPVEHKVTIEVKK